RDAHLPVASDEVAVGADDRRGVVERPAVVLVERVDDDGARLPGDPGQTVHSGAGNGLSGREPLPVAIEAEIDRRAELGEADDPGAIASRLSSEVLRLPDVDVLGFMTAELGERYPDHPAPPTPGPASPARA